MEKTLMNFSTLLMAMGSKSTINEICLVQKEKKVSSLDLKV